MQKMTRLLTFKSGTDTTQVPIEVAWPTQIQSSWSCEWKIHWPDRARSNSAKGADAIQALINAFQMIGSEIYNSPEHRSGRLSWHDGWAGYGFPVPSTIRDLLKNDDKQFL
jgi:hypothetical protein